MAFLQQGIQQLGVVISSTPYVLTGSSLDVLNTIIFYLDSTGGVRSWGSGRPVYANNLSGDNKDRLPGYATFQVFPGGAIVTDNTKLSIGGESIANTSNNLSTVIYGNNQTIGLSFISNNPQSFILFASGNPPSSRPPLISFSTLVIPNKTTSLDAIAVEPYLVGTSFLYFNADDRQLYKGVFQNGSTTPVQLLNNTNIISPAILQCAAIALPAFSTSRPYKTDLLGASQVKTTISTFALSSVPPSRRPYVGLHLDGIADFVTPGYNNIFNGARSRYATPNFDAQVPLDVNNNPLTDFEVLLSTRPLPTGRYKFSFNGQAQIQPQCNFPGVYVESSVYDPVAKTTTGSIFYTSPDPSVYPGDVIFLLQFNNIKNFSGLIVAQPDNNLSDIFTSDFLKGIEPFGLIRFMDFLGTNNCTFVNWSDRPVPGNIVQSSTGYPVGMPYEYCIALCNQTQKDGWFNIPYNASVDFITQLATLLKNTLDPKLKACIEFSNEVWNYTFDQAQQHLRETEAEPDNSNIKYDGQTNLDSLRARLYARQVKQVSDIFASVFGASAINTRVRIIVAYQISGPFNFDMLQYINDIYGPPSNYFYALATAPYFYVTPQVSTSQSSTVDAILNDLSASAKSIQTAMLGDLAAATNFGLKLVGYEAGQDTSGNSSSLPAKIAAQHDPRMANIYRDLMTIWYANGAEWLNIFSYCLSDVGPYGRWGVLNNFQNRDTTKYLAVSDFCHSELPNNILGQKTPCTIDPLSVLNPSGNPLSTYQGYLSRGAKPGNPPDTLRYFLYTQTEGTYSIRVYCGAFDVNGLLKISINNSANPQTFPITGGVPTFEATQYLEVNLKKGLSILNIAIYNSYVVFQKIVIVSGSTPKNIVSVSQYNALAMANPVRGESATGLFVQSNAIKALVNPVFAGTPVNAELGQILIPASALPVSGIHQGDVPGSINIQKSVGRSRDISSYGYGIVVGNNSQNQSDADLITYQIFNVNPGAYTISMQFGAQGPIGKVIYAINGSTFSAPVTVNTNLPQFQTISASVNLGYGVSTIQIGVYSAYLILNSISIS